MHGIEMQDKYETERIRSLEDKKMCQLRKLKKEQELGVTLDLDTDSEFSFIAGYTSGGFAYGTTHDEMNELI
jgi:hypothetical protein